MIVPWKFTALADAAANSELLLALASSAKASSDPKMTARAIRDFSLQQQAAPTAEIVSTAKSLVRLKGSGDVDSLCVARLVDDQFLELTVEGTCGFSLHRFNTASSVDQVLWSQEPGTQLVRVEEGDLLVLFTDGLSSNLALTDPAISLCFESRLQSTGRLSSVAAVANCLALKARDKVLTSQDTPYAESLRAQGIGYFGGKPDDISVTVAQLLTEKPGPIPATAAFPHRISLYRAEPIKSERAESI